VEAEERKEAYLEAEEECLMAITVFNLTYFYVLIFNGLD
jgi:hypothetical protein